jgi:hypothetical protein
MMMTLLLLLPCMYRPQYLSRCLAVCRGGQHAACSSSGASDVLHPGDTLLLLASADFVDMYRWDGLSVADLWPICCVFSNVSVQHAHCPAAASSACLALLTFIKQWVVLDLLQAPPPFPAAVADARHSAANGELSRAGPGGCSVSWHGRLECVSAP